MPSADVVAPSSTGKSWQVILKNDESEATGRLIMLLLATTFSGLAMGDDESTGGRS